MAAQILSGAQINLAPAQQWERSISICAMSSSVGRASASNSTSRSTSLSGRAVRLSIEPNNDTLRTLCLRHSSANAAGSRGSRSPVTRVLESVAPGPARYCTSRGSSQTGRAGAVPYSDIFAAQGSGPLWCPGPDSNRHAVLGRGILSPLCLPIPPPGRGIMRNVDQPRRRHPRDRLAPL